jgi:hypothetical protein
MRVRPVRRPPAHALPAYSALGPPRRTALILTNH